MRNLIFQLLLDAACAYCWLVTPCCLPAFSVSCLLHETIKKNFHPLGTLNSLFSFGIVSNGVWSSRSTEKQSLMQNCPFFSPEMLLIHLHYFGVIFFIVWKYFMNAMEPDGTLPVGL